MVLGEWRGITQGVTRLRIRAFTGHPFERIAFSIVRVDVHYPDKIVSIVLQYGSSNKIYLYIYTIG